MPFTRLFRNRWAALLWAAGMVWLALDVADVSAPEPAGTNEAATMEAVAAALANAG